MSGMVGSTGSLRVGASCPSFAGEAGSIGLWDGRLQLGPSGEFAQRSIVRRQFALTRRKPLPHCSTLVAWPPCVCVYNPMGSGSPGLARRSWRRCSMAACALRADRGPQPSLWATAPAAAQRFGACANASPSAELAARTESCVLAAELRAVLALASRGPSDARPGQHEQEPTATHALSPDEGFVSHGHLIRSSPLTHATRTHRHCAPPSSAMQGIRARENRRSAAPSVSGCARRL